MRLRASDPLLVGLLSQIIEPRSCINNDISYTFALSRGRSVRPRLHPHLLPYCQVGFCRRGPSCLPLFNAFVPCHWLSNGNQVDLKCDCSFFPLVGWVGWYLLLVKAPSAAVIPPQRPVMGCCVWERRSIQSPEPHFCRVRSWFLWNVWAVEFFFVGKAPGRFKCVRVCEPRNGQKQDHIFN